MTDAVVFDCDGILVDSEEIAWQAWRTALAPYGIEVTEGEVRDLTGRGQIEVYAAFERRGKLPAPDDFIRETQEVLFHLFEANLRIFDDAVDTVRSLKGRGTRMAVASSSPRVRLDRTLDAIGISDHFQVSIAGDEVARGKPAPDIFLRAAELLRVPSYRCTAVEDTPSGIAAAKAADMSVVAVVRGHYGRAMLRQADVVVDELTVEALI